MFLIFLWKSKAYKHQERTSCFIPKGLISSPLTKEAVYSNTARISSLFIPYSLSISSPAQISVWGTSYTLGSYTPLRNRKYLKSFTSFSPKFFPIWDTKIAQAYKCYYNKNPAEKYILFCKITKFIADKVKDYIVRSDKTLTKLIDEYNYSKYTQRWI